VGSNNFLSIYITKILRFKPYIFEFECDANWTIKYSFCTKIWTQISGTNDRCISQLSIVTTLDWEIKNDKSLPSSQEDKCFQRLISRLIYLICANPYNWLFLTGQKQYFEHNIKYIFDPSLRHRNMHLKNLALIYQHKYSKRGQKENILRW
jgi:hypothetical protein